MSGGIPVKRRCVCGTASKHWVADGGRELLEAIQGAVREIAEAAADEVFLIAHMPGSLGRGYLIRPTRPTPSRCFFCFEGRTLGNLEWTRTEKPLAFEWEPFE